MLRDAMRYESDIGRRHWLELELLLARITHELLDLLLDAQHSEAIARIEGFSEERIHHGGRGRGRGGESLLEEREIQESSFIRRRLFGAAMAAGLQGLGTHEEEEEEAFCKNSNTEEEEEDDDDDEDDDILVHRTTTMLTWREAQQPSIFIQAYCSFCFTRYP